MAPRIIEKIFIWILYFLDPMAINVQTTPVTHEKMYFCVVRGKKGPYDLIKGL